MNILTQRLPTAVEIDNKTYELNTDFRICIKIILAFEDNVLIMQEKQVLMLNLLYKEIPENNIIACDMAIKFLNCGEKGQESSVSSLGRLYSFEKDSKYIYSAIKQSHNVDLEQVEYLHWWKFVYMFLDLNENCFFNRIIYMRRQKKLGKFTKEELEMYNCIRDIIDLPEVYDEEEQSIVNNFMNKLGLNNN